jgi:hypothetical protein
MSTDIGLLDEQPGLAPVKHPARWIASGFSLQVAGIGIPTAIVLERAKAHPNDEMTNADTAGADHPTAREEALIAFDRLGFSQLSFFR